MKRIKYVSQWARDLSREEIDQLVAQAAQTNAKLGVTGILMTSGRLFFQVIEGPQDAIDRLFQRITDDPRHQDVLLLGAEPDIAGRIFPDWSMRKVDLDAGSDERLLPVREALVQVHELQLEVQQLTHRLERAIWTELASLLRE